MSGPLNPSSLPASQLQNWYDAADPLGFAAVPGNDVTIKEWADKSGKSRNASGGTGDVQYKNDGTPYLQFSESSGSWFNIPETSWMYNSHFTIFSVETPIDYSPKHLLGSVNGNQMMALQYRYYNNENFVAGPAQYRIDDRNERSFFVNGRTNILCYTTNTTQNSFTQQVYINGLSYKDRTDYNSLLTEHGFGYIGKVSHESSNLYKGKMREIIMIKGILSSTDRQRIEGYLAMKWGLRSQLPSAHPFHSSVGGYFDTFLTNNLIQNWYDAADPSGTGTTPSINTTVTVWKDKSGRSRDATGGTGNIQYKNDGSAYLDFADGATSYYSIPQAVWMNNTYFSIFSVETVYYISRPNPILGNDNDSQQNSTYGYYDNQNFKFGGPDGAGGVNDPSLSQQGRTNLICYRTTNASAMYQYVYVNGKLYHEKGANELLNKNFFKYIGYNEHFKPQDITRYQGKMREILLISGILSIAEKDTIEGYLAKKWGLRSQLPTTHPYYFAVTMPFVSTAATALVENWYDAADPLATGDAPSINTTITVWKDKSGKNRDTTGGTGDIQYKNDGFPYLDFPVAGDVTFGGSWYSIPEVSWMSSDYISIFTVESPARVDARTILGPVNNVGGPFRHTYTANPLGFASGSSANSIDYSYNFQLNDTNLMTYTMTNSPNTYSQFLHLNGQLMASNSASSFNSSVVLGFIGKINGFGENHKYMGKMREIIIIKGRISSSDRQSIEGYLAAKWGLVGKLPVTHNFYQSLSSPPTSVSATAANGSATVTWLAPSSSGASPITNYIVTSSTGLTLTVGNVLTVTFTGLANGTPLTFRVKAVNSGGNSPDSLPSASVTPMTTPLAPTGVSATSGNASAVVTWSAPSDGGSPITNYVVTPSSGTAITVGNVLSASFTGLTNGTALTFTVVARNSVGNSPSSSPSSSVTPNVLPGQPVGVSATAGNASAVVTWFQGSNEGTEITNYIVTPSVGAAITVGNVLTATVTGLANGTAVTFTVRAVNSVGNSPSSSPSIAVTPATIPGVPTAVLATPGNSSAVVTWTAPFNGGSPITAYVVTPSVGSAITVENVLTATLTGLQNGTAVTFTVVARNILGNSASSSPSLAVIPNVVPGAPTGVSATAGNASAVVTWSAGTNNGTYITNYIVTPSVGSAITVGNVLTANFTDLANGTPLTFTVMAVNSSGNSAPSDPSLSVTPMTNPEVPTAVLATRGNASAVVTWTAPFNGGSEITNYVVTPSIGQALTVGNVLTATFTGLANGTPLTFTVVARNSVGDSASSSPSSAMIPATVPDAPTGVDATPGNTSVVVTWSPSADGGSPVTNYIVTPSAGSPITVGNVLTATFTGLTNGFALTFTVVARNNVGDSAPSASVSETPATLPGVPTGVYATSGSRSATVTWYAPTSDGGSEITGYVVISSAGSEVTVGNVLIATVPGLTDGTPVSFTVKAINNIGFSSASAASYSVIPLSVPGAPTAVTAVAGINSATLTWAAPILNGGAMVTGYTITPSRGPVVTVENVLTTTLTGLGTIFPLTFTVVAINSVGTSLASLVSNAILPRAPVAGPPSSVLGVSGVAGVGAATIIWNVPISNGGSNITGYKVLCVPDNKKPNLAGPNDTSIVVDGLKNNVPTTFTVLALNATGQSDSVELTSYPLPGVPKVTAVRGASGVINLSWTAKSSNPTSPITGYVVSLVSPLPVPQTMVIPTPTVTTTGGFVSVSGLTNGFSYVFSVRSVSNIGPSVPVLSKGVIAARVPDTPTAFAGVKSSKSVLLSWTPPANNAGLPITGYTISYTVAGVAKVLSVKLVNIAIVKGLVDGTPYTFTMRAINLVGRSDPTEPVTLTPGF